MSQIACLHCGFLNFAISSYCGRCERPLASGAHAAGEMTQSFARPTAQIPSSWRLFKAWTIDAAVVSIVSVAINMAFDRPFLIFASIAIVYTLTGSMLPFGTLGRWLTGVALVADKAQGMRPLNLVRRSLLSVLSVLCLGAGFFWSIVDTRRRTWHDIVTGTLNVQLIGPED